MYSKIIIAAVIGVAVAVQTGSSFAAHGGGGGGGGRGGGGGGMIMLGGHGTGAGGAHFAGPGAGHIGGFGGPHIGIPRFGGAGLAGRVSGGGFDARPADRLPPGESGMWRGHAEAWRDRHHDWRGDWRDYTYAPWPGYDTYLGDNCASVLANPAAYPPSEYRWCLANY